MIIYLTNDNEKYNKIFQYSLWTWIKMQDIVSFMENKLKIYENKQKNIPKIKQQQTKNISSCMSFKFVFQW